MRKLKPNQLVQSLSCVQLFVTPWTAASQASLSSSTPGACRATWRALNTISGQAYAADSKSVVLDLPKSWAGIRLPG